MNPDELYIRAQDWAILLFQRQMAEQFGILLSDDRAVELWQELFGAEFRRKWFDDGLRPDFCSASPDRLAGVWIGDLCLIHDLDYMHGLISKRAADKKFRKSIRQRLNEHGEPGWFWATIYWYGVRSFVGRWAWRGWRKFQRARLRKKLDKPCL